MKQGFTKQRDFKGIWIDKNIWLSKDLTLQEKVFLVEIDSLDNEDECYANNQYFADFFSISRTRVSLVIKSLVDKGYITSTVKEELGNKRALGVFNKSLRGSLTKVKEGRKQKLKHNNISNNKDILAKKDFSPTHDPKTTEEPNKNDKILELKTKLAKLQPGVTFMGDEYKADHNPPQEKEQLIGWQKVYSDLVKWYQQEYKCEVIGWNKQYKALRLIRKIKPDIGMDEFIKLVKNKMGGLADENWHQGQFDFSTLVSQWHKLKARDQKYSL